MIKLFSHNDMDGVGCAVLAKLAFGDNVDISYCNYDDIDQKVTEFFNSGSDDECHITDIRINDNLAAKIDESGKSYKLLDHHPTAEYLNKYKWCEVKTELLDGIKTSGTELYYYWLKDNGYLQETRMLKCLVEIIRDYDTWRWASLGAFGYWSKALNDLLTIYGKDRFIDWCIHKVHNPDERFFSDIDEMLLDMHQKEIDDYIEHKNKELIIHDLLGYPCGFVFADRFISELGNKLCSLHPEIDIIAMINITNNVVSYRTIRDDIDLGKNIAQRFGGGGHPKAAGSYFDKSIKVDIIKNIFDLTN